MNATLTLHGVLTCITLSGGGFIFTPAGKLWASHWSPDSIASNQQGRVNQPLNEKTLIFSFAAVIIPPHPASHYKYANIKDFTSRWLECTSEPSDFTWVPYRGQ